jgi:glyoxylase-like metal-dependent hydrolase (beta-lactamase superfamily II)
VTLSVIPIKTADLALPRAYAYRPRRAGELTGVMRSQCLAFAIRHPEAGTILVDTGMHADASRSLREDFGIRMSLLFRTLRPAPQPFDEQLRALGIDPAEVEQVVMTHLHVDHTSGMRLLPSAEFVCSRAEWEAATGRGAGGKGFTQHHLPPANRMRLLDLDRDGEPYGPFAKTIDLLGDGTIRLVSTPGHTPGHLSVLLPGIDVLLVGDAAYTLESIARQRLPLLTAGDGRYRRSLAELKAFTERHPDATLVPTHDPGAWHALRGAERPAAAAGSRA